MPSSLKYVLMVGTPVNGFAAMGPFDSIERAEQWANNTCPESTRCLMVLHDPAPAENRGPLADLGNHVMRHKLDSGECLSVRSEGNERPELGDGVFELRRFVEGVDYCDPKTETWIWSIGKSLQTGEIFAAGDARYYQNTAFECLFLR